MSIEAIVNEFSAVAANPKGQLKAYKDAGKKCIGVMPYYAPEELVYAAGMMPFGMWGSNNKTEQRSKEYCATFYCTIAQLDLEMLKYPHALRPWPGREVSLHLLHKAVPAAHCSRH